MDLIQFMRNYAQEVGGQFSEYDKEKSIIVVPLPQGRFQTIIGLQKGNQVSNRSIIEVSSKICQFKETLDLVGLLRENSQLHYSRFSMVEDYLKLEACIYLDQVTEEILTEMIMEVAENADNWEQRLTGVDVH